MAAFTNDENGAKVGFYYRRRIRTGRNSWLNVSKSGVSASKRLGRVTVNSRGRITVRILPGLSWRIGRRR